MQKLLLTTLLFAATVILLGAYTRLTDAGLGCPDWPGCYGQLTVPQGEQQLHQASTSFPDSPVEPAKAWNEMIHRYCATALGLLILIMTAMAWRGNYSRKLRILLTLLLGLVIFQGLLGMWTVSLKLLPIVVSAHLLGGFATLSLLLLCYLSLIGYPAKSSRKRSDTELRRLRKFAAVALVLLIIQISLGGWTSSNYAALVCGRLPVCEGNWLEQLDIVNAFQIRPPTEAGYEYGVLDYGARMTIHMSHRLGALLTLLAIGALVWQLFRHGRGSSDSRLAILITGVLVLQLALGLANIVWRLPLTVAVAHNGVAALLLLLVITANYRLYSPPNVNQPRERFSENISGT